MRQECGKSSSDSAGFKSKSNGLIDASGYPFIQFYPLGQPFSKAWIEDPAQDRECGMIPKWGMAFILSLSSGSIQVGRRVSENEMC